MEGTNILSLTDYKRKINSRISRNLNILLEKEGYSQNKFCHLLRQHGVEVNQGTINKYLKKPEENIIPIAIAIKTCEIFGISLESFLKKDMATINPNVEEFEIQNLKENRSEFVTDINDRAFNGYKGEYWCYFYPTLSGEKNHLKAKLIITDENPDFTIKIILHVPNKKEDKIYQGKIIFSKVMYNCYCILKSDKLSEYVFLIFRHIYLNDAKLDCRMAEVLTVCAGESSYPTVHRLFFSREEISSEHQQIIMPLLKLNSSDIMISQEAMEKLQEQKCFPTGILEDLMKQYKPQTFYTFREDDFKSIVRAHLSKTEWSYIREYIAKMREKSFSYKFNKVSKKLDDNIRNLLISLGYYIHSDN